MQTIHWQILSFALIVVGTAIGLSTPIGGVALIVVGTTIGGIASWAEYRKSQTKLAAERLLSTLARHTTLPDEVLRFITELKPLGAFIVSERIGGRDTHVVEKGIWIVNSDSTRQQLASLDSQWPELIENGYALPVVILMYGWNILESPGKPSDHEQYLRFAELLGILLQRKKEFWPGESEMDQPRYHTVSAVWFVAYFAELRENGNIESHKAIEWLNLAHQSFWFQDWPSIDKTPFIQDVEILCQKYPNRYNNKPYTA